MDSRKPGPSARCTAIAHPIVSVMACSVFGEWRRQSHTKGMVDGFVVFVLRGSSLFSGERPHEHMLPIGINRDLPVPIGSIDLRADGLESPNDFQCRMTERIPPPAADERNLRVPGLE